MTVQVLPDQLDDVVRFHQERLASLDVQQRTSTAHHRFASPTFHFKPTPPPPVNFDVGDVVRHRRLGYEVVVTDVKDGGKKIRYREKSGFKQGFTDAQTFELVRKCPIAPVTSAPMDDPSVPLDPAKLFPDSAALDQYHCPIDNLKYTARGYKPTNPQHLFRVSHPHPSPPTHSPLPPLQIRRGSL